MNYRTARNTLLAMVAGLFALCLGGCSSSTDKAERAKEVARSWVATHIDDVEYWGTHHGYLPEILENPGDQKYQSRIVLNKKEHGYLPSPVHVKRVLEYIRLTALDCTSVLTIRMPNNL